MGKRSETFKIEKLPQICLVFFFFNEMIYFVLHFVFIMK